MAVDMSIAFKADKLSRSGIRGKALGEKLGVATAEANRLAAIGHAQRVHQQHRLTVPETILLTALAAEHAYLLANGEIRTPKTPDVSWRARKSSGWAASTAQKRLFDTKYDEKLKAEVKGRGFIHVAGNGYIWLTATGWTLVHAMGLTDG